MLNLIQLRVLKNAVLKLLVLLASWLMVWFIVTCLVRSLSPDPVTQLAGPLTDEPTRKRFAEEFGLNRPLVVESVNRSFRMLRGDWGISWRTRLPVTEVVLRPSALTIGLALISTIISLTLALLLTLLKTFRPRGRRGIESWFNSSTIFLSLAAIPGFIIGLWLSHSDLPAALGLPRQGFQAAEVPLWRTLVLPSICLGLPGLGLALPRLLAARTNIVYSTWYRSALAVGRSPRKILIQQGWPFLGAAIGDALAQVFVGSITGAVAVEYVFSLPGLGTVLVDAVQLGDLPVILGVVGVTTLLTFAALSVRAWLSWGLPPLLRTSSFMPTLKTN